MFVIAISCCYMLLFLLLLLLLSLSLLLLKSLIAMNYIGVYVCHRHQLCLLLHHGHLRLQDHHPHLLELQVSDDVDVVVVVVVVVDHHPCLLELQVSGGDNDDDKNWTIRSSPPAKLVLIKWQLKFRFKYHKISTHNALF